jgi:hypothetical protein
MFGKDYQVLDIDYAVAERRRANITQKKGWNILKLPAL